MDKNDWKELGATGLQAARITGELKRMKDQHEQAAKEMEQRIDIKGLRAGSVIVNFEILPGGKASAAGQGWCSWLCGGSTAIKPHRPPSTEALANSFHSMATESESPLFQGELLSATDTSCGLALVSLSTHVEADGETPRQETITFDQEKVEQELDHYSKDKARAQRAVSALINHQRELHDLEPEPGAEPEPEPELSELEVWLTDIHLERYAEAMGKLGYDELNFLQDATKETKEDVEELAGEVQMLKPHAKTFVREWKKLVGYEEPDDESTPCSMCQLPVPLTAQFCASCGTPREKHCNGCGSVVPADARFCNSCGAPQDDESNGGEALAGEQKAKVRV